MHVDFLRVDLNAEVHVTVPLVLTGKAIGATNGGNLHQSMHIVPVAAKPAAIPTKLEVDVTAAGHRRRAPRQRPQAGRRACASLLDAKEAIASVVAPKAEKVEEAAAAPVEGAVPAEGAAAAGRRRRGSGRGARRLRRLAAKAAQRRQEKKKKRREVTPGR